MFGLIRDAIMESGRTIKCTVKECSLGLMAESMKETTTMTRNKEKVCLHGLMEGDMMESG